jgi:hypothetical protein
MVGVRSIGPHGTGRHGPLSDEGKTDPPLDRTKARHGTGTDSATVRSGTDWTVRSISILYLKMNLSPQ